METNRYATMSPKKRNDAMAGAAEVVADLLKIAGRAQAQGMGADEFARHAAFAYANAPKPGDAPFACLVTPED